MNIIIPSILLLGFIVYTTTGIIYRKHFYQTKINSVVIKTNDWLVNSREYFFSDDNHVDLLHPWGNKILIGDSISKPAGSNIYRVYRKDKYGVYVFFGEYANDKSN